MTVSTLRLHPKGPLISRLVWGMMLILDNPEARETDQLAAMIERAVDLGVTTFDHADIYGGYQVEEHFGAALQRCGRSRGQIQLVTKCDIMLVDQARPQNRLKHYDTSREHIVNSVNRSLANFHTDYIDLLLIHRPDPLADIDEIAMTLDELIRAGKVLHIGLSNHTPSQFETLQTRLDQPLVTNQIEMSVLQLDPLFNGDLDLARRLNFAPMIWSPMGGRDLFLSMGEREIRVRGVLEAIGREVGDQVDIAQVALAWLLQHPCNLIPVLGTSKPGRLQEQIKAESIRLSRQQWFRILHASQGQDVP